MNDTHMPVAVESLSMIPATEIQGQIARIQAVMRTVMKVDVHYGIVPGTGNKPSLWKAGAEVLCATFRIAPKYEIAELTEDRGERVAYRVKCIGVHQATGIILAEGMGSASSDEEKYKWRRAVVDAEFQATDPLRRRVKYARGRNNTHYTVNQVRTEPADYDNTVLKIACKRAHIAMTLNATAASDIFTQGNATEPGERDDGDDGRGEDPRDGNGNGNGGAAAKKEPQAKQGAQAQASTNGKPAAEGESPLASAGMLKFLVRKLGEHNKTPEATLAHFQLQSFDGISVAKANEIIDWAGNVVSTQ